MAQQLEPGRTLDLHAHTTASDGDHSPTALVEHAAEVGLTALAITDHDTTAGIAEALEAGRRLGVEIIPGIELSAEIEYGQCHLLAFLIDPCDPKLLERLKYVVDMRNSRNARIVEKMNRELGFDITLDEVEAAAGGDIVARPHFARVLVQKGYAASMQHAFDEFLGKGAKAYVDRYRLSPQEAIELAHGAGGVVFLAHPRLLKRDEEGTEKKISELLSYGLDGIEARYNRHSAEDNARFLALAERFGVLTSGGSDFHGPTVKPDVRLGDVELGRAAPNVLLERIKQAAR